MRRSILFVSITICALCIVNARPPNESPAHTPGHAPQVFRYLGMCEASAAVALGPDLFVVANDNDNLLRVYSSGDFSSSIHTFVLSKFYPDFIKDEDEKKDKTDIEGAAWQGNLVFWLGSHSTTNEGKARPARHRIFANEFKYSDGSLSFAPVGKPYIKLVEELDKSPKFKNYQLAAAAMKPAKAEGALNIEGLAAMPTGGLLIGFRDPVTNGRALLAPLLNPIEVMKGEAGSFGDPIELDLGGFGIRDIAFWRETQSYIIIAGPFGDNSKNETFRLYRWTGKPGDKPEEIKTDKLQGLNPEAGVIYSSATQSRLLILSDDGAEAQCGSTPGFRRVWLTLT